jgi:hypothetical protein
MTMTDMTRMEGMAIMSSCSCRLSGGEQRFMLDISECSDNRLRSKRFFYELPSSNVTANEASVAPPGRSRRTLHSCHNEVPVHRCN